MFRQSICQFYLGSTHRGKVSPKLVLKDYLDQLAGIRLTMGSKVTDSSNQATRIKIYLGQQQKQTMDRNHNSVSKIQESSCDLCCPPDPEAERLRDNLVSQIVRVSKEVKRNPLKKQTLFKTPGGLQRLMKFIIEVPEKHVQCAHEQLYKFFQSSTRCSLADIDDYCDHIHIFLAKRNYELDLVLNQTKTLSKPIIESQNTEVKKEQTKVLQVVAAGQEQQVLNQEIEANSIPQFQHQDPLQYPQLFQTGLGSYVYCNNVPFYNTLTFYPAN